MDNLTKDQRRKNMQNIRSSGTKPEVIIMTALKKQKVYFTAHVKEVFGCPDIVFKRKKIAVFVDSDFWHGNKKRFIMPKTNEEYWTKKIKRNIQRDKEVNLYLKTSGWKVIRLWEHDVKKHTDKCVIKILRAADKI